MPPNSIGNDERRNESEYFGECSIAASCRFGFGQGRNEKWNEARPSDVRRATSQIFSRKIEINKLFSLSVRKFSAHFSPFPIRKSAANGAVREARRSMPTVDSPAVMQIRVLRGSARYRRLVCQSSRPRCFECVLCGLSDHVINGSAQRALIARTSAATDKLLIDDAPMASGGARHSLVVFFQLPRPLLRKTEVVRSSRAPSGRFHRLRAAVVGRSVSGQTKT